MSSRLSVNVGGLVIGGGAPVRVESMIKNSLFQPEACIDEIRELAACGCELVRTAITDSGDAENLGRIVAASPIPVMGDIHFDHRLALMSLGAGCGSVRVNPGNLGGAGPLGEVLKEAERVGAVIRIGANGGSLSRLQMERAGGDRALALAGAVEEQLDVLTDKGFSQIIISAKWSSVPETVRANAILASRWPFPVHIGITEAGTKDEGAVRSSVGIGMMLAQGIGDTLRVSLSAPAPEEVRVGYSILRALGLRERGARLVSCPACGRRRMDVASLAERVYPMCASLADGLTVAVMGCEVNGPREAADADIGVAGAPQGFLLFKKGVSQGLYSLEELESRIMKALADM